MSDRIYKKIVSHLNNHDAKYKLLEHDPVVSSAEATKVTGTPIEHGAKALVLKSSLGFILCVVRGSNKLDYKKVRQIIGDRKLRFAKPEEVIEVMGVEIGACYPFGEVAGIDMYVDQTLGENKWITFSPGTHDKHIQMDWDEYQRICSPKLVDLKLDQD